MKVTAGENLWKAEKPICHNG